MVDFLNPDDFMAPAGVDQEYIRYLLQQQAPPIPAPGSDELKDFGSWATQANKWGGLGTDRGFAIQSGLMSPQAFQPISTREPVEAPGFRMLNRWKDESTASPFQRWAAAQVENNRSSAEMVAELQRMAAEPTETSGNILAGVPVGYDQDNNQQGFDWDVVRYDIDKLIDALDSDPQDLQYDPETDQTFHIVQKDSPALEEWQASGYVSDPTAGYDPWSFAENPEQAMQEYQEYSDLLPVAGDMVYAAEEEAKRASRLLGESVGRGESLTKSGLEERIRAEMKKYSIPEEESQESQPSLVDHIEQMSQVREATGDMGTDEYAQAYLNGGQASSTTPGGQLTGGLTPAWYPPAAHRGESDGGAYIRRLGAEQKATQRYTPGKRNYNEAQRRWKDAHADKWKAANVNANAESNMMHARREQENRQAMADWLASMGRSPARDEVNQRNAYIASMGY